MHAMPVPGAITDFFVLLTVPQLFCSAKESRNADHIRNHFTTRTATISPFHMPSAITGWIVF
jgi:hypothetical protein